MVLVDNPVLQDKARCGRPASSVGGRGGPHTGEVAVVDPLKKQFLCFRGHFTESLGHNGFHQCWHKGWSPRPSGLLHLRHSTRGEGRLLERMETLIITLHERSD